LAFLDLAGGEELAAILGGGVSSVGRGGTSSVSTTAVGTTVSSSEGLTSVLGGDVFIVARTRATDVSDSVSTEASIDGSSRGGLARVEGALIFSMR